MALDATVGGAQSNSYCTVAEADDYFSTRLPVNPPWETQDAATKETLLIMSTRVLNAMAQPRKIFVPPQDGNPAYYRVLPQWTGAPATATQKLAWPRIGMVDSNGQPIPPDVIPDELKWAESEFAGYMGATDPTVPSDVVVQGITSVKAGSVAVTFKDNVVQQVVPNSVLYLMPQSWFTDELYLPALPAEFDVVPSGYDYGRLW